MAGKVGGKCLVTGASSGIGRAFAEILAARGHDLVLVARRGDLLEDMAGGLQRETGVSVEALAADLSARADVDKVARRIGQGDVGMVINNAGVGGVQGFLELSAEDHERMIAVNVTALTLLSHAAVRAMTEAGEGVIVNVGSGLSFNVMAGASVYAGTKAYVAQFTQSLAAEFAGRGVRFQALIPGLTRTNLGNADETGIFDQFPAEMVQSPEAVALASLAGLELDEVVCIPRLEDYAEWEAARDAIRSVGRDPEGNAVASRYGVDRA